MVNQLEKVRPNPDNIQKPFNIMLIFHASFVQMYPRPLPKIHAEPVVYVINPVWRCSAWLVQWINLTVHKSDLLLYVRLVFKRSPRSIKTANCCLNVEASPSPLSTASKEKNLRNLGAQTSRQHPKRQGEKPTHAAVQTLTNILILVNVWTHKSEKWITDAAAKKQTWNTGRHLTAMCEAELGDRFCTVNSITWTATSSCCKIYCAVNKYHPVKWAAFAALAFRHPKSCGSVRGLAALMRKCTSESQRLSQGPWRLPLQRQTHGEQDNKNPVCVSQNVLYWMTTEKLYVTFDSLTRCKSMHSRWVIDLNALMITLIVIKHEDVLHLWFHWQYKRRLFFFFLQCEFK